MKQVVGTIGLFILFIWAAGIIVIMTVGMASDGPVEFGGDLINAWTFYGFIFGLPIIGLTILKWVGQK